MVYKIKKLSNAGYNFRTGINCYGFAYGFTANCQSRNQRRHQKRRNLRQGEIEGPYDLHSDSRRGRSGYNTANISNHIVTDGADALGATQKSNRLDAARNLSGCHGVKRLFVRRGNSYAHDIKENTKQDDDHKDQKSHSHRAGLHNTIGQKGDCAGDKKCNNKNHDDPTDRLIPLFF